MKERAKSLRKTMTDAERRIWYCLRNRRLNGYKFIREQVIGCYIADFVCREKKLIVEIDGGQHIEREQYDLKRTQILMSQGYKVLRIWNNDVFIHLSDVLQMILKTLEEN